MDEEGEGGREGVCLKSNNKADKRTFEKEKKKRKSITKTWKESHLSTCTCLSKLFLFSNHGYFLTILFYPFLLSPSSFLYLNPHHPLRCHQSITATTSNSRPNPTMPRVRRVVNEDEEEEEGCAGFLAAEVVVGDGVVAAVGLFLTGATGAADAAGAVPSFSTADTESAGGGTGAAATASVAGATAGATADLPTITFLFSFSGIDGAKAGASFSSTNITKDEEEEEEEEGAPLIGTAAPPAFIMIFSSRTRTSSSPSSFPTFMEAGNT